MYYIYILTNRVNTTFYIGVTNNLQRKYYEHQTETADNFTRKYHIKKLVFFEEYKETIEAIRREKQLKNWHREWKINLIKQNNPEFKDLSYNWNTNYGEMPKRAIALSD